MRSRRRGTSDGRTVHTCSPREGGFSNVRSGLRLLLVAGVLAMVAAGCGTTGPRGERAHALQFVPGAMQVDMNVAETVQRVVQVRNNWPETIAYTLVPPEATYGEEEPVLWVDIFPDTIRDAADANTSHDLKLEISCPVVPGTYQFLVNLEWDTGSTALVIDAECRDAPIPTIVAEATRVLDAETRQALQSYDPATGMLVFDTRTPLLDDLEPGNVLVSEPAMAIPNGLLRTVSSIERVGPQTLIATDSAGLDDVFEQFSLDEAYDLSMRLEDVSMLIDDPGISVDLLAGQGLQPDSLSFSFDEVLFDQDGRGETTGDQLRVNGSVSVSIHPELTAKLDIRWQMVCIGVRVWGRCAGIYTKLPVGLSVYFFSGVTVNQNSELDVRGNVEVDRDWRVPIARQNFAPTTFWVGPVPVVITHSLTYFLDANLNITAELTYSYKQAASLRAGIEFDGSLRPVGETKRSSSESFEFAGALDAGLYFGARWESRFYGIIGPFAQLRAGLRMVAQALVTDDTQFGWRLDGCLIADVGLAGSIDLFLVKIGPYSHKVMEKCVELKKGQVTLVGDVMGRVVAADGTPLPEAEITVGTRHAVSASDGSFSLTLPPRGHHAEVRLGGYTVGDVHFTVSKGETTDLGEVVLAPLLSEADQLHIVLTWDEVLLDEFPTYLDLDSHLGGEPGSELHVNWWDPGSLIESPYAQLERDALGGPSTEDRGEEVTIAYLLSSEPYAFFVHDYWASLPGWGCQLSASGARVRVFRGPSLIAEFNVPETSPYDCPDVWSVFRIDPNTREISEVGSLGRSDRVFPDKY